MRRFSPDRHFSDPDFRCELEQEVQGIDPFKAFVAAKQYECKYDVKIPNQRRGRILPTLGSIFWIQIQKKTIHADPDPQKDRNTGYFQCFRYKSSLKLKILENKYPFLKVGSACPKFRGNSFYLFRTILSTLHRRTILISYFPAPVPEDLQTFLQREKITYLNTLPYVRGLADSVKR